MNWTKRRNYWHRPYWQNEDGWGVYEAGNGYVGWVLFAPDGAVSIHRFAFMARFKAWRNCLWHQFWAELRADNIAATAEHRQANRAGHTNHHQRRKLKGWMKK